MMSDQNWESQPLLARQVPAPPVADPMELRMDITLNLHHFDLDGRSTVW